jgi:hypothetical protein
MRRPTNKDYFIIKLRTYASPYYLKLWHEKNSVIGLKKHHEAAAKHQDFFERLYEYITKSKYNDLFFEYGLSLGDCAREIIDSDYGIILNRGEAWQTYVIPKEKTELISWFMDNIGDIPYKILKRSRIILDFHKPNSTFWRDRFRLSDEDKAEFSKYKKDE